MCDCTPIKHTDLKPGDLFHLRDDEHGGFWTWVFICHLRTHVTDSSVVLIRSRERLERRDYGLGDFTRITEAEWLGIGTQVWRYQP